MAPAAQNPNCLKIQSLITNLRTLQSEYDRLFAITLATPTPESISTFQSFKQHYSESIESTHEQIAILEAERIFPNLREQYNNQYNILLSNNFLETRTVTINNIEQKHHSITGIDGIVYPLPTYEQIAKQLLEHLKTLELKSDQSFDKLILTPFALPLNTIISKFSQFHKTTFNTDPWVWHEDYDNADVNGTLIYDPIRFDKQNHGGKTKIQILTKQHEDSKDASIPGWRISFLQSGPNNKGIKHLPRKGNGTPSGTNRPRPDIEAGLSPNQYLEEQHKTTTDSKSPYHAESGMTPEEWMIAFITQFEETGTHLDDWQNKKDSIAYLTGSYFTTSDFVPVAYWNGDGRQVYLNRDFPWHVDGGIGVRLVVRIG